MTKALNLQRSCSHFERQIGIGVQMATITNAAMKGSIAFSRLNSRSNGHTESPSPNRAKPLLLESPDQIHISATAINQFIG